MPLSARFHWLLVVLATLVVAAPVWVFDQTPVLDHSGHLARLELLSSLPLDPLLARHWSVDFRWIPNLGMDLFVPAVAPLIGADAGLRLFAGLGLFLWIAGAGLLFRAFWGRYDAQTLLAAFFAFNTSFDRGFYNFHVGAGAALAATGLWAMRRRRSPVFLAAMAAFAVALLFCHLMAFVLFALFVAAVDAGRVATGEIEPGARRRTMGEIAVVLLPAAMVKLVWMAPGDGGPVEFDLLRNLYAVLFDSSALGGLEQNTVPALMVIVAAAAAAATGRLRAARAGLALLALAVLLMLIAPAQVFGGAAIHVRMAAIVMVIALAVTRIDPPVASPRRRNALLAAVFALLATASAATVLAWREPAATAAELRGLVARHLPRGARLMAALATNTSDERRNAHLADLAAVDRQAFVPTFFTTRGQSTIRLAPSHAGFGARDATEGGRLKLDEVVTLLEHGPEALPPEDRAAHRPYFALACDFDFLLLIGRPPTGKALPGELVPVAEGRYGLLLRVAPAADRYCPARPRP